MKILVIGRGAREHALCWSAAQSPLVDDVFCAPGNVGMGKLVICVNISETNCQALVNFAQSERIDLTIVGPEVSLAAGVVDVFQKAGLKIFGPTQAAAQIEGSKAFAKEIMTKANVATGKYETFSEVELAKAYITKHGVPIVIKADGLAAGKGVVIPQTVEEAFATIDDMLIGNKFGDAGHRIVIEEFLAGEEFSLMAFVHNGIVLPMVMSQDHKRAYDNDLGPNTGGMGAYAPIYTPSSSEIQQATEEIMQPIVDELTKEGCAFTGFLYGGLIKTLEGFKVIEFNARFGDPEAEVILPLLETDLIEIILTLLAGEVPKIKWKEQFTVGVVLASEGYPDSPVYGNEVNIIETPENILTFYAGVEAKNGILYSAGGRALICVAIAKTFMEAQKEVYKIMKQYPNKGFHYRTDIGYRQLQRIK